MTSRNGRGVGVVNQAITMFSTCKSNPWPLAHGELVDVCIIILHLFVGYSVAMHKDAAIITLLHNLQLLQQRNVSKPHSTAPLPILTITSPYHNLYYTWYACSSMLVHTFYICTYHLWLDQIQFQRELRHRRCEHSVRIYVCVCNCMLQLLKRQKSCPSLSSSQETCDSLLSHLSIIDRTVSLYVYRYRYKYWYRYS